MSTRERLLLLAALCAGAFVVGIELMVTAVALPAILADLGDWTQLPRASWIVNGYLLAYIATMPLAGKAADRFGVSRLFMLALGGFAIGSILSGAAQSLDQLVAARVLQGVGAGAILPLATAGASYLYSGHDRDRALGAVGAFTFLGMAVGPFLGATVLEWFELEPALRAMGAAHTTMAAMLTPAWRWAFYLGAPLAIIALTCVWAAAPDWSAMSARVGGRIDALGALLFTLALALGLLAVTSLTDLSDTASVVLALGAAAAAVIAGGIAAIRFATIPEPFLDLRMLRNRVFAGAVLVSLLTGYAFATVIIGAAVYVDRVRYAGPEEQRLVLGTLALATAAGALGSGFALRLVRIVPLSLAGLAISVGGLVLLAVNGPDSPLWLLLLGLGLFGAGFGLTVTPRSSAAMDALGRGAFGMASAGVTVARMIGMAVGLAVLTAFGTSRIEALSLILTDQAARDAALPPALQGRPLGDPLVIAALEEYASGQAASILSGLFLIASVVLLAAILPTLLMHGPRALPGRATIAADGAHEGDGEEARPALAL
jgi:MFS family permease